MKIIQLDTIFAEIKNKVIRKNKWKAIQKDSICTEYGLF